MEKKTAESMSETSKTGCLREKVYALFFLSGVAGLVYEVLWISRFGRLFGNSSYAIGTVLAAYMGGLGLGSYLIGRRADRWSNGLRAYALLEIVVAATAMLVAPALWLSRPAYAWISSHGNPVLTNSVRLGLSLLVLLPPTLCMGGTLPVLVRFCTEQDRTAGQRLGQLYALNTLGAVVGCLLAGYVLLPYAGERLCLLAAVLMNAVVFVLAWSWSSKTETAAARDAVLEREAGTSRGSISWRTAALLLALALAGLASMGLEVAWSRVVALVLGSSVYAFTAMLAVFLTGLAIGGAWAGSILRRYGHSVLWFVGAEAGIALWLLISLPHYDQMATFIGLFNQAAQGHFPWIVAAIFLVCILTILVPAVFMGTTIPFIMSLVSRGAGIGRFTGIVYAANTIGGILGSLLGGFLLLPWLGIQRALVLCLLLNLLAGFLAAIAHDSLKMSARAASLTALLGMAVWATRLPAWSPAKMAMGAFLYGPASETAGKILFYRDGVSCTTTVEEHPNGMRTLRVNGKADASTDIDMSNQLMTGHLGMFFNSDARRVLVVGYGSGVSVGAVCHYGADVIHCAELEKAVIEADPFFNGVNHRPLEDPRVEVFIEDGRNIIETSLTPYDVIISEPSNPWMAGVADLFTQDYYRRCLDQLSPGGVMCQWLQSYGTSLEDFKMIARTFGGVFPHHAMYRVSSGDFLLLGANEPLVPDLVAIQKTINSRPIMAEDLKRYCGTEDIRALLIRFFVFDGDTYDTFCADAPRVLRDHHNPLGYSAVRNLFEGVTKSVDAIHYAIYARKNMVLPQSTRLTFTGHDGEMAASLVSVADACLKAGNRTLAAACYEWALNASPESASATAGLVKARVIQGQMDTDSALLQQLIDGDLAMAFDTCRWLFETGNLEMAEHILRRLTERYPNSATLKARWASALANMGQIDEAMTLLQALSATDPLNKDVSATLLMLNEHLARQSGP